MILRHVDNEDSNKDGISGRANWGRDIRSKQISIGRYGFKSEQPTLQQQIAVAFHQDIGITTDYFYQQNCTPAQSACLSMPTGNSEREFTELSSEKLNLVTDFSRLLQPPESVADLPLIHPGRKVFIQAGCQKCHVESFSIPANELTNTHVLYLYSDLLLHDMGDDLADYRPANEANGREWRTTPLWGLARKVNTQGSVFLHDGRARTIREAILWHGGEARVSVERFIQFSDLEQKQLVEFLRRL